MAKWVPKVVGLADFHIGSYRFPIRQLMVDLIDGHVMHMAREFNPDLFLFAGDAFRTRTPTAQDYADFGRIISNLSAPMVMIPGNHDIIGSREATTLDVYSEYPNVFVVREPRVIELLGNQICCIPWLPPKALSSFGLEAQDNSGLIRALLSLLKSQLDDNKFKILLAHCTALGTEYHDGASTVLGNDVLWTSDMFEGFDLCVLGHIHKPQQVKGTENAWYVGSPIPVSFNEADQQKTLFLYDRGPEFKYIDGPMFCQFTAAELPNLVEEDCGYTFAQVIKEHDDPDPDEIPNFYWHEIVTRPPERDIRQRVGEEALTLKPMEMLEQWLLLEGKDGSEEAEAALDLAAEMMGEKDA